MEINLLPAQYDILTSNAPIGAIVAGIGYGKSFTLAHFVLEQVTNYPRVNGLIVANTYTQLSNATIPAITGLLTELGIEFELVLSGPKKRISFLETTCFIYSLENFDIIRGIEVGWLACDEAAFSKREAIDVCFGRLRHKEGSLKARFFSSPKGFNWFYDFCTSNHVELFKGRTKDNINLPKDYYKQLVELYGGEDSPLARQELFGEFVNIGSGAVYYAFSRDKHVGTLQYNLNLPIYIGADFNIQNMNYTAIQLTTSGFNVIEAVNLKDQNANTFNMAQELWSKYGPRAVVIPDSTANARKTSAEAGVTDIRILKSIGLNVLDTKNPRIKDRHNTVNSLFLRGRIKINNSCINLIKELESLCNDEDEGSVSHAAVTLGYVCHKLEPLKLNNTKEIDNPFLRGRL